MQHTEFKNSELARSSFRDNWPMIAVSLTMVIAVIVAALRHY